VPVRRRDLGGAVPALLLLGLLLAPASGAAARAPAPAAPPSGTTCTQEQAARGECTIVAEDEREEGGAPGGGSGGPVLPRVCTWQGSQVPCSSDDGEWVQSLQCYLGAAVPEPASGSYTPEPSPAEVEQRTADGQQAYACYAPDWRIPMRIPLVWLDGPPPVDPRVVAEQAIARLQVEAVDIGMAPSTLSDDPDSLGLVGLPVHMWAQDAGASTVGPTSASATAGSVTVTATARLDRVVWSMGDGATVTCTGPGTPYDPARGAAPSPDCGHEYTTTSAGRPEDAFTVTATSYWVVDWSGGGQSGQVTFELSSSDQVRIGESQVVVTRGG
jgi:hypothetical protein